MNPPHVTVTLHQKQILIRIAKHPVRGMTNAEWLEAECFKVLGRDEMAWCGSRWRDRIQQHPGKLERVLADMRNARNEGKPIRNPGAYGEFLWGMFA